MQSGLSPELTRSPAALAHGWRRRDRIDTERNPERQGEGETSQWVHGPALEEKMGLAARRRGVRAQSLGSHWRADGAPKTGYRSQAEAQAAADNRRHVSGSDVDVYCCEFCQAWYMGNRAGGKHEDRRGRLRSHRLGSASGQCGEGGFDLDECEYEHLVGCGAQTIGMLGEVLPPRLALRLMCSASVRSVHGIHRRGLDLRHSLLGRERPGALRRRARPSSEWSPSLPRDWRGATLEAPPWTSEPFRHRIPKRVR